MTSNKELMKQARESLANNWGLSIIAYLIYFAILSIGGSIPLGSIIISGPMTLGLAIFYLNLSRKKKTDYAQLFDGFQNFGTALIAHPLMGIFIFLWMLLLIVPGIIAAFSYSQTMYIIADNPKIEPMEALRKSQEMMKGYKWKLFCLNCRFIGWALLCILTLGIGFLWLWPYMQVSYVKFYEDLKK